MTFRITLRTLAAAALAAVLTGCASPSFQACMLANACSSITTQATTLQAPKLPIQRLCVARPAEPSSMRVRIMAAAPSITEAHRQVALNNSRQVIKLYTDNAAAAVVEAFQSRGVNASVCDAGTPSDTPRLVSSVQEVTTDTGGLGWRTQVDIAASLSTESVAHRVWQASFRTGNKTALSTPDIGHVKGYADNLVSELSKSGWLPR
jgi:hypothetical protein